MEVPQLTNQSSTTLGGDTLYLMAYIRNRLTAPRYIIPTRLFQISVSKMSKQQCTPSMLKLARTHTIPTIDWISYSVQLPAFIQHQFPPHHTQSLK